MSADYISANEVREILRGLGWTRQKLARSVSASLRSVNRWCCEGVRRPAVVQKLRLLLARARRASAPTPTQAA